MTAEPPTTSLPDDFLSLALRLSLLDEEGAARLKAEALATDVAPEHLAMRHGLLGAIDIDIVETLLHPDDVVPGMRILDLLGRGGMGVVFRARQNSLDRVVAVKTILVSQMHDRTALTRFEQEALAVAKLRHPNIVAAYDLGNHRGRLYFVMELVEGVDVERYIEDGRPLDEAVAWGLLRQAAFGLSHAAAAGVVHRDIKPANLLLVDPPAGFELPAGLKMVKIADFGLAFLSRDVETKTRLTSTNTTIGSPHYIAPEQLEGDAFDHRVDIYSLGATAYHLLTGRPPFDANKLSQIVAQKLSCDSIQIPARSSGVSAASTELVHRMTRRDPNQRIASYDELLSQIDRLLAGTAVPILAGGAFAATEEMLVPPPNSLGERFGKRTSRRRFMGMTIAGMAGAGGLAAGAIWFFGRRTASRDLVPAGPEINLFDGLGLAGWTIVSGQWAAAKNDEGAGVVASSAGTIGHPLFKTADGTRVPLRNYRLNLVVQLHKGRSAEIEFAFDGSSQPPGDRYVAHLSKEGVRLGVRADDRAAFEPKSNLSPLPRDVAEPATITIERQVGSWFVFVDDSPIAVLDARSTPEAAEFRLRSEGGEVWFSDVVLQELAIRSLATRAPAGPDK